MMDTSPSNDENGLWVKVTEPVSYIVKELRLKDFGDEQPNRLTKRASLPTGRQVYRYLWTVDIYFLCDAMSAD